MTTQNDRTARAVESITALLEQTEAAHGVFETTELQGVYDDAWPDWYAARAVDQGIGTLLGHPVTVERLAAFLASTYAEFRGIQPAPDEAWSAWTARRIVAEL
jgi:hypothetical protein